MSNEQPHITEADITSYVMDSTRERYKRLSWQGSFKEYLQRVAEDPYKHTRTSYQLVRDMLLSFGTSTRFDSGENLTRYKLFDDPFDDGKNRIFGLERTIQRLVRYIDAAANELGKERILILHGPVGTAKTSIVDMMAKGLDAYTASPAGEVYTFSWRFGKDFSSQGTGGVGFGATSSGDYAGFVNPVAVLPSQLHEHPLLLIPRGERRELLERMFRNAGIAEKRTIPHKLLEAELEFNSKQIYNYLIRRYEGNWLKVMDHVLIQRIQFDESAGMGIAKIPPEGNVETSAQPVTLDENFRFIANLLTSVNLIRYYGKYVHANRGIVHYSDIFKKPANYLQHLLAAVEEHRMDFGETGTFIDTMIVGTTNIHEFLAMRNDPVSKALRSRMRKIDVPYLTNFREEERIYRRGLRPFKKNLKIAPHTTEMAARWAVMTRVEATTLHRDDSDLDAETRDLIARMDAADKTCIYAGEVPHGMNAKERRRLTPRVRRALINEHKYEGMGGVPTRTLQNLFGDLCEEGHKDCITPFRVFDLIEEIIGEGPENHDFLAREAADGWHDYAAFVEDVRELYDQILQDEIENSVVDVDDHEMESRIREYLRHVTAFNRNLSVRNPHTDKDEKPNEKLMRAVEEALHVDADDAPNFRFKLISRASAAASGGQGIDIHEIYNDLFTAVHHLLFNHKRASINWQDIEKVLMNCEEYSSFETTLAREEDGNKWKDARTLLRNMERTYGYSYECARIAVLYFIKNLLVSEE